jgi:hypothetical protein
VDESQWAVIENTHEAIIDQETFDNVQRIRGNVRRYPDGWGEAHSLTGLMYCADCGGKMYVHRTNNGKRIPQYTCSQYSKVPVGSPSQHRIAFFRLKVCEYFNLEIPKGCGLKAKHNSSKTGRQPWTRLQG